MAFDAGSILARVEIDQSGFDRGLRDVEAKAERVERHEYRIRFVASFDQSDISRARKAFAVLDNQLSRDAAQRLRSGGNGSILGTLNSLFSTQQVAGAPTPQQASQQGLLGRMLRQLGTPGGGGGGGSLLGSLLGSLAGNRGAAKAAQEADAAAQRSLLSVLSTHGNLATGGIPGLPGTGKLGPGSGGFFSGLLGGIGPNILGLGLKASGVVGLGGSLLGSLPALLGGGAALGIGGVGLGAAGLLFKGANQQVGPLIQLQNQIQQAQLTATTPYQKQQLAAQQASLKQAVASLPAAQRAMYQAESAISNGWQNLAQSFAPVLAKGLGAAASVFKSLQPLMTSFFSASATLIRPVVLGLGDLARTVLPLLAQGFRLAAPLMRPFLDGIAQLAGGLLRGLNPLLAAVKPAVTVLAQILGMIGRDLGSMFKDFAPVVRQSSVILKALLAVLSSLFPIVGKLAAIFAQTLAPVFKVFASTIRSLEPVLTIIGRILAELASAILGDLAVAFSALAHLLTDISPALNTLARILGQVFKVLENSGLFAVLGNALEQTVKPIAALVNALVLGLAPVLPAVIQLVSTLADSALGLLVTAIKVLVPIAIQLLNDVLKPLIPTIRAILPVVGTMAQLLATGLGAILTALAPILAKLAPWILAIVLAIKGWTIVQAALNIVLDANPIGLIAIAVAALIIGIVALATHWKQVWGDIKNWAMDAWNFLTHGWGQFLIPGLTAIRYAIEFVRAHWQGAWNDIKSIALDGWNALQNDLWHPFQNLLLNDIPSWFDQAVSAIGTAWTAIENVVKTPVAWVIDHVIDGLISAFDWVSSKVGGPHIAPIHPFGLAAGGRLPGYGGGDRHLALLEGGEAVISKETTAAHAGELRRWGVPGMQGGGLVGDIFHDLGASARILAAVATGNSTALGNAISSLFHGGVGGAVGDMAGLLTAIPRTLLHDAVHFLVSSFSGGGRGTVGRGRPLTGAGIFSQQMLEALWTEAGGPPGLAHLMAAIADAESGGNPNAYNPSGASGLWQILGQIVPGNIFSPIINALNAVAKWKTQGLGAWVTYTSGAYKQYYDGGGWLLPGVTVAANTTGMREAVLNPQQSMAYSAFLKAAEMMSGSGGMGGKRQVAEVMNVMMPEGSTLAQYFNELLFRVKAAEMAGYAGVLP